MRHRFHSICPYFAMFPERFVEKHLAASPHAGVVFDPFCGRGTTVFQALLQNREAAGCDLNPVAACIAGAKCHAPDPARVRARLDELRQGFHEPNDEGWQGKLEPFFNLCFHRETLRHIRYLRSVLNWRHRREDRFIAALSLGALHGESHRSPYCFSNRMPRTISTKPDYSVRWWRRNGCMAPRRDVFDVLNRMLAYRFGTRPPRKTGRVIQTDARRAGKAFPTLAGRVTDVITSPPYLNTTNYREDQWLRVWFLGGDALVPHDRQDDRHTSPEMYWSFLETSVRGFSSLLADQASIVIRIGGRGLRKSELRNGLVRALNAGLDRDIRLVGDGVTSEVGHTQANAFLGAKASRLMEHDFCFLV